MSRTSEQIGEEIVQAFQDVPMPDAAALTEGRSLAGPFTAYASGVGKTAEAVEGFTG